MPTPFLFISHPKHHCFPRNGVNSVTSLADQPAVLLNCPSTENCPALWLKLCPSLCPLSLPLGQAVGSQPVWLLLRASTCQHHENGHRCVHLEPVEHRAMRTHSGPQEDGTCQQQKDIQDLGPDGQPQNTCKNVRTTEMLSAENSEVPPCAALWFSSLLK